MSDHHFWLTEAQFDRLRPLLPNKPRVVPRVDDRRVISGIIHVIRNGLMWSEGCPPPVQGHARTRRQPTGLTRRSTIASCGGFGMMAAIGPRPMPDGRRVRQDFRRTCLRELSDGHGDDRHYSSEGAPHRGEPGEKGDAPRRIGRTKGGLNSKLHAVCDGEGKPLVLLLTEGQVSDYEGARHVLGHLPPDATALIADRGYDADWLREALSKRDIAPCIPPRANRVGRANYDTDLYKRRNLVERMFGRLKDWRRISTRYDRCAYTFMSAICIAAAVMFWVGVLSLEGVTAQSATRTLATSEFYGT